MKYKVGDAVRIKTWSAMEKEYGFAPALNPNQQRCIVLPGEIYYSERCEQELQKNVFDRILIINEIRFIEGHMSDHCYFDFMKEIGWPWIDDEIETFIKPIYDRFEILDL